MPSKEFQTKRGAPGERREGPITTFPEQVEPMLTNVVRTVNIEGFRGLLGTNFDWQELSKNDGFRHKIIDLLQDLEEGARDQKIPPLKKVEIEEMINTLVEFKKRYFPQEYPN